MIRQPGYALATILILLGVAMFSGAAIVTVSTLEAKISASQKEGIDAYYVAESGVEDSLWKIKNNASCGGSTCISQLQAGSLNYTYTVLNAPQTGQSFTVVMASTSAGSATITSVGQVQTGQFTANRKIVSTISYGPAATTLSGAAIVAGNVLTIANGGSQVTVSGGDIYAGTAITVSAATVSLGGGCIQTPGVYSGNTGPCVHSANFAPASASIPVPSFNFGYYATHNSYSFIEGAVPNVPGSFEYAVENGQSVFNGDIYVSGPMTFNTKMKGKQVTVNGRLVVDGSLTTVSGGLSGTNIVVNDPGNGHSGLFVNGALTIQDAQWNINGLLYASGAIILSNNLSVNVNGGIVAGATISISTRALLSVSLVQSRVIGGLADSTPSVLQVKHWEELY